MQSGSKWHEPFSALEEAGGVTKKTGRPVRKHRCIQIEYLLLPKLAQDRIPKSLLIFGLASHRWVIKETQI